MTSATLQNSFVSGELSPALFGRTDKAQYRNGASTMRNFYVNYRGGAMSRAGLAYIGMCKQAAPNGGGTATNNPPRDINFQYNINQGYALEFGDQYMRVKYRGGYVTETAKNITAASKATAIVITSNAHGYSVGDWVFIQNMTGMTNLNGLVWVVNSVSTNSFSITDLFGVQVNSTTFGTYVSGGTVARIYTVSTSPYAAIDLPYLKFTQSANLMYLTCWNQQTDAEYPPYTLQRVGQTNWVFTQVAFDEPIFPPATVTSAATSSTTANTWYSYVVTAIDINGNESVASSNTDVLNNNISINAGTNTISWTAVSGATSYNIYAATPAFTLTPFANPGFLGGTYGFLGSSFGRQFIDTNITPDFTHTAPTHNNPFARGTIDQVNVTNGGSGYTESTAGYTVTTSTGSGFRGAVIISAGAFVGFLIYDNGKNYKASDTIAITGGTGATATLTVGPQTGTYPGTVQFYQQRLVYANTINQPDTYFMSQPGLYNNFDSSLPTVDSDAIIGTPWGVQINGVQFMQPTVTGLLAFTGNGVWLINGGASGAAITPSDENAQAQAQIGCSSLVPPLYLNLHILYVQAKNSIVRDVAYNFVYNTFQGTDLTILSNHLFTGYTILQWAYAEEPYKVVWAVRDDGSVISLTYIKEQEIQGWSRHDTNGYFVGVCTVVEPPVDAVYYITKRFIQGPAVWVYYAERSDNRIWNDVESTFCVDCGLNYPMLYPNATLSPASLTGTNNITSTNLINGGHNYTSPIITAFDPLNQGSGATFSYTLSGGIITAITPITSGQNYSQGTYLNIIDATGSGAIAQGVVTNYVDFTTDSNVFTSGMVGNVIRADGGKATIVQYISATHVIANVTQALTIYVPNDPFFTPQKSSPNAWSISVPTQTVSGLNHLEGMQVSILADGGVNPPQTVKNGQISLQSACSSIIVGLPFVCQLQTMYLDPPSQVTTQGKRKDIQSVTLRLESSRGMVLGTNQPDQSTNPDFAILAWTNMKEIKERNASVQAGVELPLFTGDYYVLLPGDWDEKGQVAVQQTNPLPCTALAIVANFSLGDQSAP